MNHRLCTTWFAALLLVLTSVVSAQPPERVVDLTATDGTKLKATYFAAANPGPGVLLHGLGVAGPVGEKGPASRSALARISHVQ